MPGPPNAPLPATPRRRRWRFWAWTVLAVAAAAWCARFAYQRITLRPTPRPDYWADRIQALDPPGPDAVPAFEALRLLRQFDMFESFNTTSATAQGPRILGGSWDSQRGDIERADVRFESDEYQATITRLERLVNTGWEHWFELDLSWGRSVDHHADQWGLLLMAHSRWAREDRGDLAQAQHDWLLAAGLARELRRSRTCSGVHRAGLIERGVGWELARAAREVTEHFEIRGLAAEIQELTADTAGPGKLFEGERFLLQALLEKVYVRDRGNWLAVKVLVEHQLQGFGGAAVSRGWNLASPLFHDLPTARSAVDALFQQIDSLASLADCRALAHGATPTKPGSGLSLLDGLARAHAYGIELRQALRAHYSGRCTLEAGVIMLALNQYRLANGDYPETLAELVPEYLPALPIDRADGRPLRYRRSQDGYVLYSAGPDGIDNAGALPPDGWPSWQCEPGYDVVFSAARRNHEDHR